MDTPGPEQRDDPLFEACITRARGEFALAMACTSVTLTEHELGVVDVALAAGVVGALSAMRDDNTD